MADSSSKGAQKRTVSLLLILLLMVFCAGSFYVYMNTRKVMDENENSLYGEQPMPDLQSIEESKELVQTGEEFVSMGRATSLAMQTALLAEVSGKYPVAEASSLIPAVLPNEADGIGGEGGEFDSEAVVEQIEPDPPQVTVLAIMISGQDKIAMVDIFGEDSGLVVKQGTKFSGGDARITKIDEKGVTFTWMGKSYTVAM